MKKNIVLNREVTDEQFLTVEKTAPQYEVVKSFDEIENPEVVEIILGFDEDVLNFLDNNKDHNIKWLQASSAGVDKIPLERFNEEGILLTAANGIHAKSITESVFGYLTAHYRGLLTAYQDQQKGIWTDTFELEELSSKSIMLVGIGHIGQQIGKIAQAFEMETIGVNRSGRDVKYMNKQYTQNEMFDHLEKADIIVNSLPLTNSTRKIYDTEFFQAMKKDSVFINVGRGESVDESALIHALDYGPLAFAALDVFKEEPLPENHSLWTRENVLITPHTSGMMEDYIGGVLEIFLENLEAYLDQEELPRNLVNLEEGY